MQERECAIRELLAEVKRRNWTAKTPFLHDKLFGIAREKWPFNRRGTVADWVRAVQIMLTQEIKGEL